MACMQWKVMYHRSVSAIDRQKTKHSSVGWDLIDDAYIIAQMDAFVQRCRDLIEVCESAATNDLNPLFISRDD